jgi:DNA-binding CsgD family transcriptional regulator
VYTSPARAGLIVVDASLTVVASNSEALNILTFPDRPENIHHLDAWVANKIRLSLIQGQSPPRFVGEFHSANRTYLCRSYPVELAGNHKPSNHKNNSNQSGGLLIVMLERKGGDEMVMVAQISQRFGLTAREQETVQLLLEGLTSKEIAQRMKISPNTVKAFIRLVMVKMGVSTRSGIIGKIAGSRVSLDSSALNGSWPG